MTYEWAKPGVKVVCVIDTDIHGLLEEGKVYEIEGKLQVLATPHNDNTGRLKYISTIELTFDIHNGLKVEVIPGIG